MEPFTLILAAFLAQTTAASPPASPPPPARAIMQADTNADGIVTRDEALAQADAQFAAMDTDHDGKLTRDERRAGMAAMRAARSDGDGTPRPPRGDRGDRGPRGPGGPMGGGDMTQAAFRERAGERFDRLDGNHDGKVDPTEVAAARAAMRGPDRASE